MFGNFLFLGTTEKKTFGKVYEMFSSGVKNWFLGKYKKIFEWVFFSLGGLGECAK